MEGLYLFNSRIRNCDFDHGLLSHLNTHRAVSFLIGITAIPLVTHLFTLRPDGKPFFLALDPDGLERIHQSHVCRIRQAMMRI